MSATPISLDLDFPPLVAMSNEAASEAAPEDGYGALRVFLAVKFCRLLSDLTRPASRDAWLRWLGATLGWEDSPHCPTWEQDDYGAWWVLERHDGHYVIFSATDPDDREAWFPMPLDNHSADAWATALGQVIRFVAAGVNAELSRPR